VRMIFIWTPDVPETIFHSGPGSILGQCAI